MGMHDEYRIRGGNRCPVCGGAMQNGQGKWGPRILVCWTEGEPLPTDILADDPEQERSLEQLAEIAKDLPSEFWFSWLHCDRGHEYIGNGFAPSGCWTTTKLYLDRRLPCPLAGDYVVWRISKSEYVVAPSRWVSEEAVVRHVSALAWSDRYIVCTVHHAAGPAQDALWLIDVGARLARGPLTTEQYEELRRELELPDAWHDVADLTFEGMPIT